VLEDLDAIVERCGESELLSLLDGEGQIDNVVFIATTNYPERLDPRIVNRPSRFDRVVKIGMPTKAARKMYIASRLGDDFADLELWSAETKDLSIAHIKEIIVSVHCLGLTFEDTLARVKLMKNVVANDELLKPTGFMSLDSTKARDEEAVQPVRVR
jgi:SpoVK/Ycf46/Vps4 family AAA+-type ATPase